MTKLDRNHGAGRVGQLLRRVLPSGLTGLAGTACAACCVIPVLLAAGILGGAGWAAVTRFLPAVAVASAAAAGLAWWWANLRRRHQAGCAGGDCSCGTQATKTRPEKAPVRSAP
jgi:mercuric ion transport protein